MGVMAMVTILGFFLYLCELTLARQEDISQIKSRSLICNQFYKLHTLHYGWANGIDSVFVT